MKGFYVRVAAQCDTQSRRLRQLSDRLRQANLDVYAKLVDRIADDTARTSARVLLDRAPSLASVSEACSLSARALREVRDRLLEASLPADAAWAEDAASVLARIAADAAEESGV